MEGLATTILNGPQICVDWLPQFIDSLRSPFGQPSGCLSHFIRLSSPMAFELRLDSSTLPTQGRNYLRTSSSAGLAPVVVPRLYFIVCIVL